MAHLRQLIAKLRQLEKEALEAHLKGEDKKVIKLYLSIQKLREKIEEILEN